MIVANNSTDHVTGTGGAGYSCVVGAEYIWTNTSVGVAFPQVLKEVPVAYVGRRKGSLNTTQSYE